MIKKCPVCNSTRFEVYMGNAICRKCGYKIKLFDCKEIKK